MKKITFALIGLMHTGFAFAGYEIGLPAKLDQALIDCGDAMRTSDTVACPSVKMYALPRISKKLIDQADDEGVLQDLYENGKRTSARAAFHLLENSIQQQVPSLEENTDGIDENLHEMRNSRQKLTLAVTLQILKKTLSQASRDGHEIRSLADTYWAPSVNARGVLIIDRKRSVLTVILHGDTDG